MPKGKRGTSLSFIAQLHGKRKSGWDLSTAMKLIKAIQEQMVDENCGGFKWDPKVASKATGKSPLSCHAFKKELKKAMEENMTLEEYFKKGRPFRYGKKVLAS